MNRPQRLLTGILAGLVTVAIATPALAGGSVSILDAGHVLSPGDQQSIRDAAQQTPFAAAVLIVNGGYAHDEPGFVGWVDGNIGAAGVVIALDPADHWVRVSTGQNSGLTIADAEQARQAAAPSFSSGQWRAGIIAALQSLAQAPSLRSGATPRWLTLLILIALLGGSVLFVARLTINRARSRASASEAGRSPG